MRMKFAYLILAHDNFKQLQRLLGMLDDSRNDIFVHIDGKVRQLPALKTAKANLYFLDNRVDVRWGTYSQIQAHFELYRESHRMGPYDFYHLIAGTTLPLKSQDFLHAFFDGFRGASLFRIWPEDAGEIDFKLRRIHFWTRNFQSGNKGARWLTQHFWTANMFVQKKLGVRINRTETFCKSDCWASLSESAVCYLLMHEKDIQKKYRHTFAGDEFYLVSELKKDPGLTVVDCSKLLYVEFVEGQDHPADLTKEEFVRLQESDFLFARKFSDATV